MSPSTRITLYSDPKHDSLLRALTNALNTKNQAETMRRLIQLGVHILSVYGETQTTYAELQARLAKK